MSLLDAYLADEDAYNKQQRHSCSQRNVNSVMDYFNRSSNSIAFQGLEKNPFFWSTNGLFDDQSSDLDTYSTTRVIFTKLEPGLCLGDFSPKSSPCSWRSSSQTYGPHPITEVIADKLFLGCENHAFNEDKLFALGITHILSLTNRINAIEGLENEHFVMNDSGRTELKKVLKRVYPFMKRGTQGKNKLYVYCKLGQNRSPTVVISFLMKTEGLTLYAAHKMLWEMRPLVQVHHNYAKMLLELERELFGETSLPDDWMEVDTFDLENGEVIYKSEKLTVDQQQSFKINQRSKKSLV